MIHISPTWVEAIVAIIGVLLIPTIAFLVRGALRWARTDRDISDIKDQLHTYTDKQDQQKRELVDKIDKVVDEERNIHGEIIAQLRDDRAATDKRLRFMEEFWMKKGQGNSP